MDNPLPQNPEKLESWFRKHPIITSTGVGLSVLLVLSFVNAANQNSFTDVSTASSNTSVPTQQTPAQTSSGNSSAAPVASDAAVSSPVVNTTSATVTVTPPPVAPASAPTPPPVPVPTPPTSYASVSVSQYANNPSAYQGSSIVITGLEKKFLPGATNFMEVTDLTDPSQPLIVVQIDDESSYTATVNGLQSQYYPIVRVYGTAVPSQQFTQTNSSGVVTVSDIDPVHIDVCTSGGNNSVGLACSGWTRLF